MKKISLIGSTGSIGRQVIDVVKRLGSGYKITALVAFNDREGLERQVAELKPEFSALASEDKQKALLAAECADIVVNAAGGFAGLEYSLRAKKAKKPIALANKETLVCGGALMRGAEILPVDSEHSAIWQCLNFDVKARVRRLIITASGGAFRGIPADKLASVTPEQALAHPTWKMGKKITIDSATLMNKGYEVIEAHELYGTPYADIHTVIQPQSVVHSLVEFSDGSITAQMSYPTMELPIQLALTYPERRGLAVNPLDFGVKFSLGFEPLERKSYPCFDLALKCGEAGGTLPCVLNAADEVAVKAFLEGRIAFTDIARVVSGVLDNSVREEVESFEMLKEVDFRARRVAESIISGI